MELLLGSAWGASFYKRHITLFDNVCQVVFPGWRSVSRLPRYIEEGFLGCARPTRSQEANAKKKRRLAPVE